MARPLIDDALWALIEPLLPPPKPRRADHPGRRPVDARRCLTGIVFVLKTGIQWEDLPAEMGVSGMTCWRRLRDWQAAGVWARLHEVLLARLRDAHRIDWARAVVDSSSVRAVHGGEGTGPSPVDRRKAGSKHHLITDGRGIPLAAHLTGANRHDSTQLRALVQAVPAVRGKRGRPRRRPRALLADRGYDAEPHRRWLRALRIRPQIARRRTPHGSGLGVARGRAHGTKQVRVAVLGLARPHRAAAAGGPQAATSALLAKARLVLKPHLHAPVRVRALHPGQRAGQIF